MPPAAHQPPSNQGAASPAASSARQDSASPTNPSVHPNQRQNRQPHLHSSSGQQQGKRLLMQARLSRGWTQQQLADQLGTTPQTVSRWERGIATPGPYHRGKLSALFGLELNSCFNEADEASPEHEAEAGAADEAGQAAEAEAEAAPSPAALTPPVPVIHRRPAFLWRIIVGCGAVILLAAFLALIALNGWLPATRAPAAGPQARPQSAPTSTVGTIAFLSSGDFAGNSAAGMNDEVAIHLVGVPLPPAGTSYFAWMTNSSSSEAVWTPLGRLAWTPAPRSGSGTPSSVGSASLFSVSPQHTNWLVTYSRFLITEEATSIPPQQPSSAWMYQASISTTPTPGDPNHYSLLDHLRHLLAADPQLAAVGINGGLVYWLARNSEQVAQAASGLQGDWQRHQFRDLRQRLISMLTYLDGSSAVQTDLPPGTPAPSPSPFTRIGLLTPAANQEPPGYILHTDIHLEGVRDALGATAAQRQEALRLRTAMNAVGFWLTNVREDAIHLLQMDDAHLAQTSALQLLTDLITQAKDAAQGPTAEAEAGANWIEQQSQQLATFTWYRV